MMIKKFNAMKIEYKIISIVLFSIIVFSIYLGIMQYKESKRIGEYKDTKIKQELYINNKKFKPSKPYKIRNEIVFLPLDDVIKALGEKVSYEEKSFGKIVLKYQDTTYNLKKGSNIVYIGDDKEEVKMDGRVELMEGRLYVPLEFVKDCMKVNILELSGNRVFIDSFKEHFNYDWVKNNKYIAHAMGGIDKRVYTNSLEAFEKNYDLGYRVFEIDLSLTSDNEIVLLHAWNKDGLKKLGLPTSWSEKHPTFKEFMNTKINGMYTPLSFRDVCNLMKKYDDVKFVIDVKGDINSCKSIYMKAINIASQVDKSIKDRFIPQIYKEEMLDDIMSAYDFKSIIYSLYKQEILKAKDVIDFAYENGVKVVVMDYTKLKFSFVKELNQRGIYVYANTYNDTEKVKKLENMGVKGIYSDFINPKTEKNRYEDEKTLNKKE